MFILHSNFYMINGMGPIDMRIKLFMSQLTGHHATLSDKVKLEIACKDPIFKTPSV